ncbi:MAG: hypothetical protein IT341_10130 [Chloroflexi bacterium]|nr:hypothetical protein [Chloroflexota bacterium]
MASMDSATVTMPLENLDEMRAKIGRLEKQVAELRRRKRDTEVAQVSVESKALIDGMLAARNVVAWAAGMLPPETTKGWPAAALATFAEQLKKVAGDDDDVVITANDLLHFVDEIAKVEQVRQARTASPTIEAPLGRRAAPPIVVDL